jgi:hypothetical protein
MKSGRVIVFLFPYREAVATQSSGVESTLGQANHTSQPQRGCVMCENQWRATNPRLHCPNNIAFGRNSD